jgi:hypothetical protein
MKKKLIIHPGYGKCGTTFLQRNIFNNKKILQIGRIYDLPNPSSCRYQTEIIKDLYAKIFDSVPRSKISENQLILNIKLLAKEIVKLIKKNDSKFIVLSDERIFEFYYNDFENNLISLKLLINEIIKYQKLDISIVLTIRNQSSFILSYYSYFYHDLKCKFKSINKFINKEILNKKKSLFWGIDFYKVYLVLKKFFSFKIYFLALEDLSNNSQNYLFVVNKIFPGIKFNLNLTKKIFSQNKNSYWNIVKYINSTNNNFFSKFFLRILPYNFTKKRINISLKKDKRKTINLFYKKNNKKLFNLTGINLDYF